MVLANIHWLRLTFSTFTGDCGVSLMATIESAHDYGCYEGWSSL